MPHFHQIPEHILGQLAHLSEAFDEEYHHTLGEIKAEDLCILQCISVISHPLHIEEFAELFAFSFTAGPIPKYHKDQLWKVNEALSILCPSVIKIDSSIIKFSVPPMKDYLLISPQSPHLSVNTSPLYQVFKTPAHTCAAQVCLGILLHLDNTVTQESLQEYPLAEYAAKHWIDHTRFEGIKQDVEDGLRALFDPSKAHLSVLIWIHNPGFPLRGKLNKQRSHQGSLDLKHCYTMLLFTTYHKLSSISSSNNQQTST